MIAQSRFLGKWRRLFLFDAHVLLHMPLLPFTQPEARISRLSRRRWDTRIFQLRPCTFHWPRKLSARPCRSTLSKGIQMSLRAFLVDVVERSVS